MRIKASAASSMDYDRKPGKIAEYFPFYMGDRWTIFHLLTWLRKYYEVCCDENYAD